MNRVLLVVVAVGSALIGAAICWLVMRTDRLVVPMPSVPSGAEADRPAALVMHSGGSSAELPAGVIPDSVNQRDPVAVRMRLPDAVTCAVSSGVECPRSLCACPNRTRPSRA
jgi:hypothetical protein